MVRRLAPLVPVEPPSWDRWAFAGLVCAPVRGAAGGERLIGPEQAVEEAARVEPVRALLQRAQFCGQEAGADAPFEPSADAYAWHPRFQAQDDRVGGHAPVALHQRD